MAASSVVSLKSLNINQNQYFSFHFRINYFSNDILSRFMSWWHRLNLHFFLRISKSNLGSKPYGVAKHLIGEAFVDIKVSSAPPTG